MNSRRSGRTIPVLAGAGVLVLLAGLVTLGGCGREGREQESGETVAVPVEVTTAALTRVSPTLSYSGGVEPWRKAALGAAIPGRVEKLHVDTGDRVAKGDLLFEMAGEQLTQARAELVAVEKDWQRMKALLEKGVVTQQAFDQMNGRYEAAEARCEMVLESTRITAPFAGVVSGKYMEEGEVFTQMPSATGVAAILGLAQIDTVKVTIQLSERDRTLVRTGLSASVVVDGYPDRAFEGVVGRVDPVVDPRSRTTSTEVLVPNPRELLRPGMFADVQLALDQRDALVIDRDAIIRQEGTGKYYVYVVDEGVASRHDVELGMDLGDRMEIVRGLADGDLIATAGRYKLHDGAAVKVTPAIGEEDVR